MNHCSFPVHSAGSLLTDNLIVRRFMQPGENNRHGCGEPRARHNWSILQSRTANEKAILFIVYMHDHVVIIPTRLAIALVYGLDFASQGLDIFSDGKFFAASLVRTILIERM